MEIFIKGNLITISGKEQDICSILVQGKNMKETGNKIIKMVSEFFNLPMEINIKEIGFKIKDKDWVNSIFLMVLFMKETLSTTVFMEKES
jgi:hypothetical protein